jgi:GT2 family glycosyltransferase
VTLGDVDLCARIREKGLLVVVTPHARLLHFESLSRGYMRDPPVQD